MKTGMPSKKLEDISFIKTIMMVVIVLYHSMLFFGGTWFTAVEPARRADFLYYFAMWMNTFHIQTFAMASGFLFYYLKIRKGRYNDPRSDIKKRAIRLLVPYFFTCLFWVIPIGIFFYNYSLSEIFSKYVLMTGPSQLWFLIMLFMVFIFFELFSDKFKVSFKNLVIVFLLSTTIGFMLSKYGINYFQIAASIKYILYFYLGGYIYTNKDKITLKQVIIMIAMAIPLYTFVLCFNGMDNLVVLAGTRFAETLVSVLEVPAIYYLFSKLIEKRRTIVCGRIFHVLEQNSFGIYLFHQQIIYFVIFWLNGVVSPIILVLCSFIIALFVSLAISLVLRKFKVTRFMFGLER